MRLYILAAAAATVAVLFAGIAPLGSGPANRWQKFLATAAFLFAGIAPAGTVFIGNRLTGEALTAGTIAAAGPRLGARNGATVEPRVLPAGTGPGQAPPASLAHISGGGFG